MQCSCSSRTDFLDHFHQNPANDSECFSAEQSYGTFSTTETDCRKYASKSRVVKGFAKSVTTCPQLESSQYASRRVNEL